MQTVFKAALAYLVVTIVLRIIGRRTASQQAPMDMVVLFLFGGLSVSAVLGEDHSFFGAMSALFTVGMMHVAVSWLKIRFVWLERLLDGTPIVVLHDGRWTEQAMRRLRLQQADIRTAARQRGLDDMEQVKVAIVERDGTISIIEKD
ncbi:uncharacterized protein DUF421 [Sphingomonas sp. BK036]|uniref:DUF421 domain-containing protein n=1 Tax=Sphingomonas sp. BK036 TaxID=2512122 RepID=UPI0010EF7EC6|nr:YetF domain-containing protein [Sphingomonas sp. BK036]RZT57136.1 uncharacterized protein DUF421 [Sphingomonas sp. BK036]